VVSWLVDKQVM